MDQSTLELAFKKWWEESYGRLPLSHSIMTHVAFAAYVLKLAKADGE